MPKPGDLLTQEIDPDPDDELRMELDQGQGNNLAGAPQPQAQAGMVGQPGVSMATPGAPPAVQGPLAAIPAAAKQKPRIKLKLKPKKKPHIKLKVAAGGLDGWPNR